jgi:hypothetical protein
MEILAKLFGSAEKVKMMKLFLFNPDQTFDNTDISERTKITSVALRRELTLLSKINFIKKKSFSKEIEKKSGGKLKSTKKKVDGWVLDRSFPFLSPLQNLLIDNGSLDSSEIVEKLKKVGNLKLVIVAGVFIQDLNSRADILIVGDGLNELSLERSIKNLEAEVGKELRYVVFETADFKYRLGIYDKLLRDILDYSHRKLINKIGV